LFQPHQPSGHSERTVETDASVKAAYENWVYELSTKLYEKLDTLNKADYDRVLNMWKIGAAILAQSPVTEVKVNHDKSHTNNVDMNTTIIDENDKICKNQYNKVVQNKLQILFSQALGYNNLATDAIQDDKNIEYDNSINNKLVQPLPIPFTCVKKVLHSIVNDSLDISDKPTQVLPDIADYEFESNMSLKEIQSVKRDVFVLVRHPQLLSLLEHIIASIGNTGTGKSTDTTAQRILHANMMGDCIAKIFQGVSLESTSNGYGNRYYGNTVKDWTDMGERYKHVHYYQLRELVLEYVHISGNAL
jgi:hypothetical protein